MNKISENEKIFRGIDLTRARSRGFFFPPQFFDKGGVQGRASKIRLERERAKGRL